VLAYVNTWMVNISIASSLGLTLVAIDVDEN
jgi:hypothetical protein